MSLAHGSNIAVIGAGIAGLTAAYYLQQNHNVDLYEQQDRIGGHTNTIKVNDKELGEIGIDTGFIVLNDRTYPNLHNFFKLLQVPVRFSDMSFSVVCGKSGIQYASHNKRAILGKLSNLLKSEYYQMLFDFRRFWKDSQEYLGTEPNNYMTVAEFATKKRYSQSFINNFIVPMGAAIWSSPDANILDFPLKFFLRFFNNHGMLSYADQPRWQTVCGGSWSYLKAFKEKFNGKIHLNQELQALRPVGTKMLVQTNLLTKDYDHVVLATPASFSAKVTYDYNRQMSDLLSSWSYQSNFAVLHTDDSWLPKNRCIQASWNYSRQLNQDSKQAVSVTYDMNRLQGLTCPTKYCVTLNPDREIKNDKVIYSITYQHPQYSIAAERAQAKLDQINTDQLVSLAGAYCGFGFHEDGCLSGVKVAKKLGAYT